MNPLYWRDLKTADLNRVTLVDVRTPDEYALGGIDGAVNVPLDELRERLAELPLDKPVWVYCGVGLRGYLASNILKENGYDVRNLIGGLKTYKAAVTPVCIPGAPEDVCVRKSSNTCCVSQEEKGAGCPYCPNRCLWYSMSRSYSEIEEEYGAIAIW